MRYATAGNFRTALEEKIRLLSAGDGFAIQRVRKHVAFERFLARLQAPADSPWFLKGAFALELRFRNRARTTRDLDLGMDLVVIEDIRPNRAEVAKRLRAAAGHPLNDFFVFGIPVEGEEILSTQVSAFNKVFAESGIPPVILSPSALAKPQTTTKKQ